MARKKRTLTEINASSMADIAFLLLIFFLVTTTMDVDTGLIRMLPPPIDENAPKPPEINARNVFEVLVNARDQLLVESEWREVKELKDLTKEFILNPNKSPNLSDSELLPVALLGNVEVSKGVVSLQNDKGTSYKMYIQVQNALAAAYNELRDDLAMKNFGKTYKDLSATEPDKAKAIKEVFPQRISEAEPKDTGIK